MIEDGLYSALKAHAGVAAKTLVSGSNPPRYNIFPILLPKGVNLTGEYAITYTPLRSEVNYQFSVTDTIQINAFGRTYEQARQLAADIDDAINNLRTSIMGGNFPVAYVQRRGRQSLYDETSNLFYVAIDYSIKY